MTVQNPPTREKLKTEQERFARDLLVGFSPGEEYFNCSKLAADYGVSRQRVHQIKTNPVMPDGWVPVPKAAEVMGMPQGSFRRIIREKRIKHIKVSGRIYVDPESYEPKVCKEHGNPIPAGRYNHCSQECLEQAVLKSHKRYLWRKFREKYELSSKS